MITGKIINNKSNSELYIRFCSNDGFFITDKIKCTNDKFVVNLRLKENTGNHYDIEITNNDGKIIETDLKYIEITHGIELSGIPLPHSIGIAVAKKDLLEETLYKEYIMSVFKKGSVLPLVSEPMVFYTRHNLEKGKDNDLLIKIYEGESVFPQKNSLITRLQVKGEELITDLPENTEVQILLEINESREITTKVYIPVIDKWLEETRTDYYLEDVDKNQIVSEYETTFEKYKEVKNKLPENEMTKIENRLSIINEKVEYAENDPDLLQILNREVKEISNFLFLPDRKIEFEQLKTEYEDTYSALTSYIQDVYGENSSELLFCENINEDAQKAIKNSNRELLLKYNIDLEHYKLRILFLNPVFVKDMFFELVESQPDYTNKTHADYLIKKANTAINNEDYDGLRNALLEIIQLLPGKDYSELTKNISGLIK